MRYHRTGEWRAPKFHEFYEPAEDELQGYCGPMRAGADYASSHQRWILRQVPDDGPAEEHSLAVALQSYETELARRLKAESRVESLSATLATQYQTTARFRNERDAAIEKVNDLWSRVEHLSRKPDGGIKERALHAELKSEKEKYSALARDYHALRDRVEIALRKLEAGNFGSEYAQS